MNRQSNLEEAGLRVLPGLLDRGNRPVMHPMAVQVAVRADTWIVFTSTKLCGMCMNVEHNVGTHNAYGQQYENHIQDLVMRPW